MGGRSAEVERGRGKLGTSLGRSATAYLPTPLPMGPRRRAGVPSPTGASTELLRIIWAPDAAGGVALGARTGCRMVSCFGLAEPQEPCDKAGSGPARPPCRRLA